MAFHIIKILLDLLNYNLADMVASNEAIVIAILTFMAKTTDTKNKHLWHYIKNLIDNLERLQFMYFRDYNLTTITLVMRFLV